METFDLLCLAAIFLGAAEGIGRILLEKVKGLLANKFPNLYFPQYRHPFVNGLLCAPVLMWRGFRTLTIIMIVALAWIGFLS